MEQDLDLAIVGGVDVSLDPFELIGFAKTGALTDGEMTVYDRGGKGPSRSRRDSFVSAGARSCG